MEIRRCPSCRRVPIDGEALRCPDCDVALVLADERSLIGERMGSYRLLDVLGAGGMGVVFRAEHERLQSLAAVKVMQPKRDRNLDERRFEREAQMVARLRHPNVVAVYDYDQSRSGLPYLVMELLDGRSVGQLLRESPGGLPPAAVSTILLDVVSGLGAAHAAGIIHRDLKPANVFVAREAGRAVAKLLDFGVAKPLWATAASTELTASSAVVGTPHYLAPEQLRGEAVGPATDQYALALLVCELLSGTAVRDGHTLSTILTTDINQPVPVEKLLPALADPTARALARATEPSAGDRFPDLESFRRALELPDAVVGRDHLLALVERPPRGRLGSGLTWLGRDGDSAPAAPVSNDARVSAEEPPPTHLAVPASLRESAGTRAIQKPEVPGTAAPAPEVPGTIARSTAAVAEVPGVPEVPGTLSPPRAPPARTAAISPLTAGSEPAARRLRRFLMLAAGIVALLAGWWVIRRGIGVTTPPARGPDPPPQRWSLPATALGLLTDDPGHVVLSGPREWIVVAKGSPQPTRVAWPPGDAVIGSTTDPRLWVRRQGRLWSLDPVSQQGTPRGAPWPSPLLDAAPEDLRISPLGGYLARLTPHGVEVFRIPPDQVTGSEVPGTSASASPEVPGTSSPAQDDAPWRSHLWVPARRQPPISRVIALSDRYLAIAEGDAAVALYRLADGVELWQRPLADHQLRALALGDDLPWIAVGGQLDGVRTFALTDGAPGPRLTGVGDTASLAWIPDTPTLAVCGERGLFRWNPRTDDPVERLPEVAGTCADVRFGSGGLLAIDGAAGELVELPVGIRLPGHRVTIGGPTAEAWDLLVAERAPAAYVGMSDGALHRVAADGSALTRRVHDDGITALAARGDELASASDDHTLGIWRLPELDLRFRTTAHDYLINALALAGESLWSSSSDRQLKRWSWPKLTLEEEIDLDALLGATVELHALWASSDGNQLVLGTWGRRIVALSRIDPPAPRAANAQSSWQSAQRLIPSGGGYRFVDLPALDGLVLLGVYPRGLYLLDRRDGRVALDRVYRLPTFGREIYGLERAADDALWLAGPSVLFRLELARHPATGEVSWRAHGWVDSSLPASAVAAGRGLLAIGTADGKLHQLDPTTLVTSSTSNERLASGLATLLD